MNTTRSEAKTGWETNVNLVFLLCFDGGPGHHPKHREEE